MAERDQAAQEHSFSPTQAQANRTRMQGGGVGQREMDLQRDPNRFETATVPERTEPFDTELDAEPEARSFEELEAGEPPAEAPEFGEGAPANLDPHDIGEKDNPQLDWGEPLGDDGLVHGSNHTRRPDITEAQRGQGPKTRRRTKDIINRKM